MARNLYILTAKAHKALLKKTHVELDKGDTKGPLLAIATLHHLTSFTVIAAEPNAGEVNVTLGGTILNSFYDFFVEARNCAWQKLRQGEIVVQTSGEGQQGEMKSHNVDTKLVEDVTIVPGSPQRIIAVFIHEESFRSGSGKGQLHWVKQSIDTVLVSSVWLFY